MKNYGYAVVRSAGTVKHTVIVFDTEEEAEDFCEYYNWEFVDENEFVWDLHITKIIC